MGRNLQSGNLLCKGDRIYPNQNARVEILCYSNKKRFKIQQSSFLKIEDLCTPLQPSSARRCTPLTLNNCPTRKGPNGNENAPKIIQPYGKILINNRPLISWSAVTGATSYTVLVKGPGVDWQTEVKDTTLSYPSDRKELQYGNAFTITVIVNSGNSPISADSSVVHLLSESKIKQINQVVQQINSLGLAPDEIFVDLNAIYMSEGLLNETIETLKERARAKSQNPSVYRILGDRYIEAWLPEEAKRVYTKAVGLARVERNSEELAIAQERLRILESQLRLLETQSQLPTRTNPAQ
jgi:hypothetical protein